MPCQPADRLYLRQSRPHLAGPAVRPPALLHPGGDPASALVRADVGRGAGLLVLSRHLRPVRDGLCDGDHPVRDARRRDGDRLSDQGQVRRRAHLLRADLRDRRGVPSRLADRAARPGLADTYLYMGIIFAGLFMAAAACSTRSAGSARGRRDSKSAEAAARPRWLRRSERSIATCSRRCASAPSGCISACISAAISARTSTMRPSPIS